MSSIRDEIRAILREELSAILAGQSGVQVEHVRVESSDDLNAFARQLVEQLAQPMFAEKVKSGEIRFELDRATPAPSYGASSAVPASFNAVGGSPKPAAPMLDKKLITESDLEPFGPGPLRVPVQARITPLAKDEARRKGIRIERVDA